MDMQLITNDMLVKEYGDSTDGIKVYKGSKSVGYLSDLRKIYAKNKSKKFKEKEYRNKVSEERREKLPEAVEEMKLFLENNLSKYDANVFINYTQPNVHINKNKCYIIVDPISEKHRLGVVHKNLNYSEMAEEVDNLFHCTPSNTSNRHILISGLSRDDILEIIKKLCLI